MVSASNLSTAKTEGLFHQRKLVIQLSNIEAIKSVNLTTTFILSYDNSTRSVNKTLYARAGKEIALTASFELPSTYLNKTFRWSVEAKEKGEREILNLSGTLTLDKAVFTYTYLNNEVLHILDSEKSVLQISIARIKGTVNFEAGVNKETEYEVLICIDKDNSGNYSSSEMSKFSLVPRNGTVKANLSVETDVLRAPFKIKVMTENITVLKVQGVIDWSSGSTVNLTSWRKDEYVRYAKMFVNYTLYGSVMKMPTTEIIHHPVYPVDRSGKTNGVLILLSGIGRQKATTHPLPKKASLTIGALTNLIDEVNNLLKFYWPLLAIAIGLLITWAAFQGPRKA